MNCGGQGRWHRASAIGALLLVLGLGALVALRQPVAATLTLAEARRLWLAQAPPRYTLTITQQTAAGACEQEFQIDGTTAVAVHDDCRQPVRWTVPRLFNWIAELERERTRCYPDPTMCACRGTIATSVRYDAEQGYPRAIVYEWRKRPNLTSLAYYRSLFDRSFPGCNRDGTGGAVVYAIGLAAQP